MKEGRDLAVTLLGSALLLAAAGYFTQCSHISRPGAGPIEADRAGVRTTSPREEAESEAEHGTPGSRREGEEDEGDEERVKIQRVGRALQTIGANPELRKTYGLPP